MNPQWVIDKAQMVAIRLEERDYLDIYPRIRDQAHANQDQATAEVYQRVIDSEQQHAEWFQGALEHYRATQLQAV